MIKGQSAIELEIYPLALVGTQIVSLRPQSSEAMALSVQHEQGFEPTQEALLHTGAFFGSILGRRAAASTAVPTYELVLRLTSWRIADESYVFTYISALLSGQDWNNIDGVATQPVAEINLTETRVLPLSSIAHDEPLVVALKSLTLLIQSDPLVRKALLPIDGAGGLMQQPVANMVSVARV